MSKSKRNAPLSDEQRVSEFLELFKSEGKPIRDTVASILPAFNDMLNMCALSFEEFALQSVAIERGIDFRLPGFDYKQVIPPCPKCRNDISIRRMSDGMYFCNTCRTKFSANYKSISSNSNCTAIVWYKILQCMLNFYTMERSCQICNITIQTYINVRNKIFYGMSVMMDRVKIYGNVQIDHTFTPLSYRGTPLADNSIDSDCEEDTLFVDLRYKPRVPNARGGSKKGTNGVCILTMVDDRGHAAARLVGLGSATTARIKKTIGDDKLLRFVPAEDPFLLARGTKKPAETQAGDNSLLISDKEYAFARFAAEYPIQHHTRKYEKDGVRLSVGEHHIQNVNNLHSQLKKFLQRVNHSSSRYLRGFLVLFEFIYNTGATPEAIQELMRILAAPGLGDKAKTFFEENFRTPSLLEQWFQDDNPLKHLNYDQMHAYCLYFQREEEKAAGRTPSMMVKEIAEICHMTPKVVCRNYHNLRDAGFHDAIISNFEDVKKARSRKGAGRKKTVFSPDLLAMYDEYAKNRVLPPYERLNWTEFTKTMNLKYGTNYTCKQLEWHFYMMRRNGVKPPLPEMTRYSDDLISLQQKRLIFLDLFYREVTTKFREKGTYMPSRHVRSEIATKAFDLPVDAMPGARDIASHFRQHKLEKYQEILLEYEDFKKKHKIVCDISPALPQNK